MPLGGSSGRSPASGRNPTRRVAIHFLSFPRPPSWSSPSGAGMNSRSPPPSTRPFFVSRMRGRSATEQGVVLDDRAREGALGLEHRETLQVGDDALGLGAGQRDADRRALPCRPPDDLLEELPELVGAGQGELEPDLEVLELGLRRHRGTDEDERPSRAGEVLGRFSEQPQRGRRFQMRHRVLQQPGPVPRASPDQPERAGEVGRLLRVGGMDRREAARRAPAPERDRQFARHGAHQGLEALLLDRLADDEGVPRAQQEAEVPGGDVQTGA